MQTTSPGPVQPRRPRSKGWYWLLLLPYVALLWVSSYNSSAPVLAGIPFFYWYQLVWIWVGALLTYIVYRATEG